MKRNTSWLLFFLLLFVSCEEKNNLVEEGFLYISTSKDMNVVTRSTVDDEVISVAVCKAATGDTIKFFEDYAKELGSGKIQLPVGLYYVKAGTVYAGKAAFDKPFYFGIDTIEVVKATLRESEVICSLANVKVTVNYSDLLKQYFIGYKTTVSNTSGELSFEEEETRAGYFTPGKLNIVLDLVNNNGTAYKIVKEISGTKAREHYRLNFSIGETPDSPEAGGDFNVTVNEKTNDIECTLNVPVFTDDHGRNMPKIVTMPEKELSIKETNPAGALLTSEITSKNGLQVLALKFASKYFNEEKGIPAYVDLMTVNEEIRAKLIELGIAFPQLSEITTDATLDFSAMLTKLPLLDGKKTSHSVTIVARDNLGQQVEDTIVVNVRPNKNIEVRISPWSRKLYLNAIVGSNSEDIEFQYKRKSDPETAWQIETIGSGTGEGSQDDEYIYATVIRGLEKNTEYEYKCLVGVDEVTGEFVTADETPLVNSSFDDWYEDSVWKPGVKGADFWSSGNTKTFGVTANFTTPVDSRTGAGKAAQLKSDFAGVGTLGKFGAGNIFTGIFELSGTDGILTLGREYTSRPVALTGYYKYKPKTIDYTSSDISNVKGIDTCSIYIALTSEKIIVKTKANERQLFNKEDKSIIAYAELDKQLCCETNGDDYHSFTLPLVYRKLDELPKYIIIVCSSSKYGDYFVGGTGSTLWLDDFSLDFTEPE